MGIYVVRNLYSADVPLYGGIVIGRTYAYIILYVIPTYNRGPSTVYGVGEGVGYSHIIRTIFTNRLVYIYIPHKSSYKNPFTKLGLKTQSPQNSFLKNFLHRQKYIKYFKSNAPDTWFPQPAFVYLRGK